MEKFSRISGPPMARAVADCATSRTWRRTWRPMKRISASASTAEEVLGLPGSQCHTGSWTCGTWRRWTGVAHRGRPAKDSDHQVVAAGR
ncbi:hypothetical protein RND61_28995 [Streptomyces sp. TRM76323]|uniref:Uncharacterized protein n=1 Tax=Streptomyces tamarix TaxID=3078565 RepID=A0ABU3QTJ1_9ACTN|nr:hypothetical protein [Streptomyces tamarix]MDT9686076.1 hypothetical protein [Streptomyces tamarix]